jgi:hypothetical protein
MVDDYESKVEYDLERASSSSRGLSWFDGCSPASFSRLSRLW